MRKLRFAIFGNIYQAKKSTLVKKLLCSLEERGAEIYIDRPFYDYLTQQLLLDISPKALIDDDNFEADYAVSMGGDGTFLQTASRVRHKGIPIIGINMGRMGLLTDTLMSTYRRHAVVAILVVAAIITPTTDVFTLFVVALPIYLLYEVSILIVKVTN